MPAGYMRMAYQAKKRSYIPPSKKAWRWKKKRLIKKAIKKWNVPKIKQTHFHIRRITTGIETNFSVNTSGGEGEFLRAATFKLSDLQAYGELYNIYDQYMITKVVLDFQWTITATSGSGPNASYAPQLNYIRDYTDGDTPTSGLFRESSRVHRKRLTANNPFRIALTPAVQSTMYQSAVTSGYAPKWNQRLSMEDFAIPHYGLKYQIICPTTDVGFIQVTAKYYVSCYQTQ